jgi:phosphonoacetaldehyde hydrolase
MAESPQRLAAVLFDWAGTTVDYGSRAPTDVFLHIFRERGIEITQAEARGPMGSAKRDHIQQVVTLPRVAECWRKLHGRSPTEADVDAMYRDFLPIQKAKLAAGSDVIPGVVDAVAECRRRGLKIGSTTGYTRELMEVVIPPAARAGFSPDVVICADDVSAGRPAPWMNFHALEKLGVFPMSSVLVVDDTPVGIKAGLNTGAWTVAISQTGNAMGLSEAEVKTLPAAECQSRLAAIERDFRAVGAHYVLHSVAELPGLLDRLEIHSAASR